MATPLPRPFRRPPATAWSPRPSAWRSPTSAATGPATTPTRRNGNGAAHLASANGHDLDDDSGEPPILIGEVHADPRTGDGAEPQTGIEAERIADRFGRPRNGA